MKFFAGSGAGDIEETLLFGTVAARANVGQPQVELVGLIALAPDGSQHNGGLVVAGDAVELQPVEQDAVRAAGRTLQARNQDQVPLQPLGLVDSHQIDLGIAGTGFRVKLVDARGEISEEVVLVAFGFYFTKYGEQTQDVGLLVGGERNIRTQRAPGALDVNGERCTSEGVDRRGEGGPRAV